MKKVLGGVAVLAVGYVAVRHFNKPKGRHSHKDWEQNQDQQTNQDWEDDYEGEPEMFAQQQPEEGREYGSPHRRPHQPPHIKDQHQAHPPRSGFPPSHMKEQGPEAHPTPFKFGKGDKGPKSEHKPWFKKVEDIIKGAEHKAEKWGTDFADKVRKHWKDDDREEGKEFKKKGERKNRDRKNRKHRYNQPEHMDDAPQDDHEIIITPYEEPKEIKQEPEEPTSLEPVAEEESETVTEKEVIQITIEDLTPVTEDVTPMNEDTKSAGTKELEPTQETYATQAMSLMGSLFESAQTSIQNVKGHATNFWN